jgi:hypothetical protein
VVSGDRSRRRLSSELPCALPLLVAGDMAGDATRRGVRGGIIRRGEEKTSMAMFAVGMKERLVTVTTRKVQRRGDESQTQQVASGCAAGTAMVMN